MIHYFAAIVVLNVSRVSSLIVDGPSIKTDLTLYTVVDYLWKYDTVYHEVCL